MKHFILIATLLFSLPSFADSTFLSGLDFYTVYQETDNNKYSLISKNGISVKDFINTLNDTTIDLGEKVAIINALSSYYEFNENATANFKLYQDAFYAPLKKKYSQNYSFLNESITPETRLLWVLMTDFYSTTPNVKMYQWLAKKMPNSLTAQTVSVLSYAYDILYNNLNDFKTIQDLKNNHLKSYFENLNHFNLDVPIEIKVLSVEEFLLYTLDCESRLKCLVDTSSEELITNGLNKLSDTIKSNINNEKLINDVYSSNWINSKKSALEWINLQENYIAKINASDIQKAEIIYFFNSKIYQLTHNIDNFSMRFYDSSYSVDLNKSKNKIDILSDANDYLSLNNLDLEKKGVSKKDIEKLFLAKNKFKIEFESSANEPGAVAVSMFGANEANYTFESNFDALHYLMFYFYIHPEKITEMYDLE